MIIATKFKTKNELLDHLKQSKGSLGSIYDDINPRELDELIRKLKGSGKRLIVIQIDN